MQTLWSDAGQELQVVRLTTPGEIAALLALFEAVAAAEGWQPAGALQHYQAHSVYFALQSGGQLIGGLQLVVPDAAGELPYRNVWPEVNLSKASQQAHIAVLALDAASRGQGLLFWRLAIEMWRYCVGANIAQLSIEVTPRVLPLYHRLGWPLVTVGEQRLHWGEDCVLCTLGVAEVAAVLLQRAEHAQLYRQIITQAFRLTVPIIFAAPAQHDLIREPRAVYLIK